MKNLLLVSLMGFSFISCSNINFNEPLSDENDPLNSPLRNLKNNKNQSSASISNDGADNFPPGSWVETAMPDADFYKKYPRFGGRADKTLSVSTGGKVISHKGSYTKLELDAGDVGYVPTIMLIEKIEDSYSYSPPEPRSSRAPIPTTSSPPPPSEDEILSKIKAREESKKRTAPQISVPTTPTQSEFVAPEPEVQGIQRNQKSDSITPPSIPSLPDAVPQVAPAENSIAPVISPVTAPKPDPSPAPSLSVPATPPTPEIKINKPVSTGSAGPINAPSGGKINQDAALEIRITEPFVR